MRTRYVLRDGELVPKENLLGNHNVLPDIAPFVTQDGVEITSRSHLRDYERRNGIRQVGNDWSGPTRPPFWDQFEAKRKRG